MATTTTTETIAKTSPKKLVLRSYDGLTWRDILAETPRDCTADEVPVLDLQGLVGGDLEARKAVAKNFLSAAENTGFFYIKNHGVPQELMDTLLAAAHDFFYLPMESKNKARLREDISSYGYMPLASRQVNPSESRDVKETFSFHYEPRFDPLHADHLDAVPQSVLDALPQDGHVWSDCGVPHFHAAIRAYYQAVLALARRLMGVVALALDLPEDHFAALTAFPGADMAVNFYPGRGPDAPPPRPHEVGLGAHTDLQTLTLLYQSDDEKGLQVLNRHGAWVYAPPQPGTFVVNIGDMLMRMSNDRLPSTVHRVVQHSLRDRYSLPVFFGLGFRETCAVLPTCCGPDNPPKYAPETAGELIRRRLRMGGDEDMRKEDARQAELTVG